MNIEKLRLNIDIIDDKIIKLLEDREKLVKIIEKEKNLIIQIYYVKVEKKK